MLIKNQWYAVLESPEVKAGKPASFKRLGHNLVFWRTEKGKVVAMEDRCPHRQAALSPGKIVNGNIECPFHGIQFGENGACQLVPANGVSGPRPAALKATVFPTREEYGFIWVWNGDPRPAGEYPPLPFFDEVKGFAYSTLRRTWAVHYTRAIENQMDVAHLPFVHATTIGRGGRTLINGPYSEMKDDAVYIWPDFQVDHGQHAARPGELTRPDHHWLICFKFPNIWLNRLSAKFMIVAAFAPVDEEKTVMYVRMYHDLVKWQPARRLFAKAAALGSLRILLQDEKVVLTQNPKMGGPESGDRYIPADRPILLYYKRRKELEQAAEQPSEDLVIFEEKEKALV